jgi:hypothetical protein
MTINELYEYAKANGIENRPIVITGYDGDLDELTKDIIKDPSEVDGISEDEIPEDAIVFDLGYC